MGLREFGNSVVDFFRGPAVQNQMNAIKRELSDFKNISISYDLVQKANALARSPKYNHIPSDLQALSAEVNAHNREVERIQSELDDLISNQPIEHILEHIKNYTVDTLRAIETKVKQIDAYTQKPSNYFTYSVRISKICSHYNEICKQFSLIQQYQQLRIEIPDYYLTQSQYDDLMHEESALFEMIQQNGTDYYSLPQRKKRSLDELNEAFICRHISDRVFDDVGGKKLDDEQRRAILCDSISNLTVAGAGSGKTLTICGKVKYLLETKKANTEDILLLSYSHDSAKELNDRIQTISSGIKVKTFHSLGLEILNTIAGEKQTVEDQLPVYVNQFLEQLSEYPDAASNVLYFFSYYLSSYEQNRKQYASEGERLADIKTCDYTTLKDRLISAKENKERHETIKHEFVKSYEELAIANFLYINGIHYEYERAYEHQTSTDKKRQYTPDFYLTDYGFYLEHYGIDRNGRAPQYEQEAEQEYLDGIRWKRMIHENYQTKCLETYSFEFKEGTVFNNLTQRLSQAGVKIKPLSAEEIAEALHSIHYGYDFSSFCNLVETFVSLYKSQYPDGNQFRNLKKHPFETAFDNKRAEIFLDICYSIYRYYQQNLKAQGKIDFDDMILKSIDALDHLDGFRYKYIIVDEFQDISQSRARFLKKLIEHGQSKLFAVGDDWQSIYRFAGCDISIFLAFDQIFKEAKINYITSTHRNSAELQVVVEPFITKNPEQYQKHIHSTLHQDKPVRIIYHDSNKIGAFYNALEEIEKINPKAKILVLCRNRRDVSDLICDEIKLSTGKLLCKRFPTLDITCKTVHGSKGLEEDFVILISGENARNGFPNQMEDDVLLSLVLGSKGRYQYAEERRLFYVALTRTRSIVYVLSNKNKPSVFVKEIEPRSAVLNPELIETDAGNAYQCPLCKGGKLELKKRNSDGHLFYGCTNFPLCKYTNSIEAVESNRRCPQCGDYMQKRNGPYGEFYKCSNMSCKKTESLKSFGNQYSGTHHYH